MKKRLMQAVVIGSFVVTSAQARTAEEVLAAGDPQAQGQAIAAEFDARDTGFGDVTSTLKMTLGNAQGATTQRRMRSKILEIPDPGLGDKSIVVFDNPRDVAGTALLSYAKILEADDQWLYLPALGRVKRISSKNKSGPFMGSEFAYEDITANEIGKYDWKYLASEACPNDAALQCFKLETLPKYEYSGYTRRIVWIDTAEFRPQQIDYYDRKDALMKTQIYRNYERYLGQFWRAHDWEMTNHLTGKTTALHFADFHFRSGLGESDFTTAALKRVK